MFIIWTLGGMPGNGSAEASRWLKLSFENSDPTPHGHLAVDWIFHPWENCVMYWAWAMSYLADYPVLAIAFICCFGCCFIWWFFLSFFEHSDSLRGKGLPAQISRMQNRWHLLETKHYVLGLRGQGTHCRRNPEIKHIIILHFGGKWIAFPSSFQIGCEGEGHGHEVSLNYSENKSYMYLHT